MLKLIVTLYCFLQLVNCSKGAVNKKVIHLPPEETAILMVAVPKCMEETGVGPEALVAVYQGGYLQDQKFKDFLFCCFKARGHLNRNGSLNVEKASAAFKNEPLVNEDINRCYKETTGPNAIEALFNYFKCYQETGRVTFTI